MKVAQKSDKITGKLGVFLSHYDPVVNGVFFAGGGEFYFEHK